MKQSTYIVTGVYKTIQRNISLQSIYMYIKTYTLRVSAHTVLSSGVTNKEPLYTGRCYM
jgi:hypothetical protein